MDIYIDPGYSLKGRGCALAMEDEDGLVAVWFERPPVRIGGAPRPRPGARDRSAVSLGVGVLADLSEVVLELPQQDSRSRVVPPSVLIRLTHEGTELAARYAQAGGCLVRYWTPAQWKHSEAKVQQHRRLWGVLTPEEQGLLGGSATGAQIEATLERYALSRGRDRDYPAGWLVHNLLDAAAMWAIDHGRMVAR